MAGCAWAGCGPPGRPRTSLREVRAQRLFALFHVIALRGLRRGEAASLGWRHLDLDAGTLTVSGQLRQVNGMNSPDRRCGLRSRVRTAMSWADRQAFPGLSPWRP